MSELFAVVEHNQASGQPDDRCVTFCDSLPEAVGLSDALTKANREDGRRERYLIYSLDQVEDDELYDWATREPDGQPLLYVHERAARNCCPPGHEVVKRRLGTTDWTPAPEEEL